MSLKMLRTIEIAGRRGDSKSSLYADIRRGLWPKLVAMGPRTKAQPESEVNELIQARVAGRTEDQLRALVLRLEAARKTADQGTGATEKIGPQFGALRVEATRPPQVGA